MVEAADSFKRRNHAWSTLQGFESLRILNKGQLDFWLRRHERKTLVRERSAFMNRLFNVEVVFN
ncbi:transposase [Vibrio xuii]|nr:transposase [Vibrio xuii]